MGLRTEPLPPARMLPGRVVGSVLKVRGPAITCYARGGARSAHEPSARKASSRAVM
jgi:hypothetical protein